ncbi:hypothetical protein Tsubulata_008513 [Turnera subulata]|uniref:Uncharacterized protein n=1 Tax=Turnera subulata TaxID=218843 RepID=A0A9Q0JHA8_9ROSI|nr:hypothetical protein Tsubulata_008513 [Turnera subulata]
MEAPSNDPRAGKLAVAPLFGAPPVGAWAGAATSSAITALMTAVMAEEVAAPAQAPAGGAPKSGATASLPALGSLLGASIVSFVAFYLQ